MLIILLTIGSGIGLINNTSYKRIILRTIWNTRSKAEKDTILINLFSRLTQLINHNVLKILNEHINSNGPVCVISASPEFYVKPFVKSISQNITVHGSVFNENVGLNNMLNLHAKEKVMYAQRFIDQKGPEEVFVYTDSISDLPIIKLANHVRPVKPNIKFRLKLRKLGIRYQTVE
jgi:phosphoserine phosphatase